METSSNKASEKELKEMKYLVDNDLKEIMLNNGVLHEVNRTFFHPLGLALGIKCHEIKNKAELIIYLDDAKEGTVFKYLDRFKMQMFRDFCQGKYLDREDAYGFIIQTKDFEEADKNYKENKKLKTRRLEIIFKHFRTFCFNMQKKIMKHHDDLDKNNQFPSKDVAYQMLQKAFDDNDWVSVATWAMILENYTTMKHEIITLELDNDNG